MEMLRLCSTVRGSRIAPSATPRNGGFGPFMSIDTNGGQQTLAALPRNLWRDAKADFPFLHCGREYTFQALALPEEVPNPLPDAFCFSFML